MTNVASNTLQELSDQELDSVSGGVKVAVGPVHLVIEKGYFGFGIGNMGFWVDTSDGTAGGHIGGWSGHIG
jgi:bacteriocin-like protein